MEADDDGEIEFEEFLTLVKGKKKGKPAKKGATENKEADKLFNFFQSLTNKKLQPADREQPFPLFYGSVRRQKILAAMMETQDKEKKKEGKKILENYKKQLNDKIQRERKEREKMKA